MTETRVEANQFYHCRNLEVKHIKMYKVNLDDNINCRSGISEITIDENNIELEDRMEGGV